MRFLQHHLKRTRIDSTGFTSQGLFARLSVTDWKCFGLTDDFAHNQSSSSDGLEKNIATSHEPANFVFTGRTLTTPLTFVGSAGWACSAAAYAEVAAAKR